MTMTRSLYAALFLLAGYTTVLSSAEEAPRRLRLKGSPRFETSSGQQQLERRRNLFRIQDVYAERQLDETDFSVERNLLDEEDEVLWNRFLQGGQSSFVPQPTPTLPAGTQAPAPTTTTTPAPVTSSTGSPTLNANTDPPVSATPAPTAGTPVTPAPTAGTPVTPAPTATTTAAPTAETAAPTAAPGDDPLYCGCDSCTEQVWNMMAGGFTCGERIEFIVGMGSSEVDACRLVAGTEFPDICGPSCDPDVCDQAPGATPSPTVATTAAPTADTPAPTSDTPLPTAMPSAAPSASLVPEPTVGTPDTPLPTAVASEAPSPSLAPEPTLAPVSTIRCGCATCNEEALSTLAGEFTCLARINFLVSTGEDELDACRVVAGMEFPIACAPCDPDRCEAAPTSVTPLGNTPAPTISPAPTPPVRCGCNDCAGRIDLMAGESTCGERIDFLIGQGVTELEACTQVAGVEYPFVCGPSCDPNRCDGQDPPLEPRTPLYCFPDYDNRQRFENVWGDFTLEVKESGTLGVCGPSFNQFTRDTVSVDGDELTLRYQKNGDLWEASEVRVVLPQEQMPFQYGTFSWSVSSIQVRNANSGEVRQNFLPPSLVLGMFTWDATEDFTIRENFNREVDIELTRLGEPTNDNDAQFLAQPVTDGPNYYRFSTRDEDGNFNQAPQEYEFTWNPAAITWDSSVGVDHFYTTEQAITLGLEDYVQCLPADLEVRMNLWNLDGAQVTPLEMSDDEIVEVVIDNFTYTPTGETGVEDGGFCSRDCQCLEGSECTLGNNQCTPL